MGHMATEQNNFEGVMLEMPTSSIFSIGNRMGMSKIKN